MISHRGPNNLTTLFPNRAGLRVRPITYLKRNPAISRDLGVRFLVLVAGCAFLQWPLVVIGALLLVGPVHRYFAAAKVMRLGSPCAAKVVSLDPPRVACLAEMSRAINVSHLSLMILKANFEHETVAVETGDRIAVVALPVGGTTIRAANLLAYIASSVCDEPPGPVLEAVPEWHWDDLEDGLFGLQHPYALGMHTLV